MDVADGSQTMRQLAQSTEMVMLCDIVIDGREEIFRERRSIVRRPTLSRPALCRKNDCDLFVPHTRSASAAAVIVLLMLAAASVHAALMRTESVRSK